MSESRQPITECENKDELLHEFRLRHPKGPELEKLWNATRRKAFRGELLDYYNGDTAVPRHYGVLAPLRHENLLRHAVKNHSQLANISNTIYQDHERRNCESLYIDFQADTSLKSRITTAILEISKFESFSTDFKTKNTKSRHLLLTHGETEVQVVLKDPGRIFSPTDKITYNRPDLWKDPFHPINLTWSYDSFKRYTQLMIENRRNRAQEVAINMQDDNTFKRLYMRYMHKRAESNQEFILAVISIFGTDVRFYPGKVLQYLQDRKMLKDEFEEVEEPTALPVIKVVFTESDTVQIRNAEYLKRFIGNPLPKHFATTSASSATSSSASLKPLIQVVKLIDLTEDGDCENFNSLMSKSANKEDSRNASPQPSTSSSTKGSTGALAASTAPTSTVKPLQISISGKVRTVTQDVTKKDPIPNTTSSDKGSGIGLEAFRHSTQKLWQMFFEPGFNMSATMSNNWYQLYLNHLSGHKDQLHNCVAVLLQDRSRSCYFDIPRLHPATMVIIKSDFSNLEMSRRNVAVPFDRSTVEGLMHSQTSPLQLALQDPTTNKSVPGPMGWSPINIHMPYQAFEEHLAWRLAKIGKGLEGLSIEMVKLRFAEYLSIAFIDNPKQFILGIFTAYGPDFYTYPVRVLQLLKKRQVVRQGSRLHALIQLPMDGRSYTALVPMKGPDSSVAPTSDTLFGGPPPFGPYMPEPRFEPVPPPGMEPNFVPHQFGTSIPPQHQFPYQDQIQQHPMDDFPRDANAYNQGVEGDYLHEPFREFPPSQFMKPMPPPPAPIPPPQFNPVAVAGDNFVPSPMQLSPLWSNPMHPAPLPSILTIEAWRSACDRSLSKHGARYGITPLSDKDYKVLYDRYLVESFDNSDDFLRGILTGISLARYPRDNEETISTCGLLNLPRQQQPTDTRKSILKPILKPPPPAPSLQRPESQNSITVTRDDLIRISSILETLIPNSKDAPPVSARVSQPESQPQPPRSISRVVEYNHHNKEDTAPTQVQFDRRPVPVPRNIESPRNYEDQNPRVIDYDHANPQFVRRPAGGISCNNTRMYNPIKRTSNNTDDMYDNLHHKKPRY